MKIEHGPSTLGRLTAHLNQRRRRLTIQALGLAFGGFRLLKPGAQSDDRIIDLTFGARWIAIGAERRDLAPDVAEFGLQSGRFLAERSALGIDRRGTASKLGKCMARGLRRQPFGLALNFDCLGGGRRSVDGFSDRLGMGAGAVALGPCRDQLAFELPAARLLFQPSRGSAGAIRFSDEAVPTPKTAGMADQTGLRERRAASENPLLAHARQWADHSDR